MLIYGLMVGMGSVLYAAGAIGQGATHNDCSDYRHAIAVEQGISQEDVPQEQIKTATQECLDEHGLSKWEAFRTEYLMWAVWPALVSAGIFFVWPLWAAALHRQELDDEARGRSNERTTEGRGMT